MILKFSFLKNKKCKFSTYFIFFFISFSLSSSVLSIVIRHDRSDEEYRALAQRKEFQAVGQIEGKSEKGTATLVKIDKRPDLDGRLILTAYHNIHEMLNAHFVIGKQRIKIIQSFASPNNYKKNKAFDIAFCLLEKPIFSLESSRILFDQPERSQLHGKEVITVGYGNTGRSNIKFIWNDNQKRAMRNFVLPEYSQFSNIEEIQDFPANEGVFSTRFSLPIDGNEEGTIFLKDVRTNLCDSFFYNPSCDTSLLKQGFSQEFLDIIKKREWNKESLWSPDPSIFTLKDKKIYFTPHSPLLNGYAEKGDSGGPAYFYDEDKKTYSIIGLYIRSEPYSDSMNILVPNNSKIANSCLISKSNIVKIGDMARDDFMQEKKMNSLLKELQRNLPGNQSLDPNSNDRYLYLPAVKTWAEKVFNRIPEQKN